MEEDLISSLTRQVKEEVIEHYLTERRLVEIQIEDLEEQAAAVRLLASDVGKRITRLSLLAMHDDKRRRLIEILQASPSSVWNSFLERRFTRKVRFIRVIGLTGKTRYRKLFFESYRRFYEWMEKYRKAYENLEAERQAVNANIKGFHSNFDLLTILNFVKSLDISGLERKHFLGENFTAEELASIDQALYFRPVAMEKLDVPPPLALPKPETVEHALNALAAEIYARYEGEARRLMA